MVSAENGSYSPEVIDSTP